MGVVNDEATCCIDDEQKCRGASVQCNANRFKDSKKDDVLGATDLLCCTAQAMCSTIKCPAGMKHIAKKATTPCATDTCTTSCTGVGCTTDVATCCVDDPTLCKRAGVACAANMIKT